MSVHHITELDALNAMLASIGSSPLTNLSNPQNADALAAQNKLDSAVREIQAEKWYFNTEDNYPLNIDEDGRISVPKNLVSLDSIGRYGEHADVVIRGAYLYDRGNHTYTFNKSLTANVQWCLAFDELPEIAKQYITARATRQFQEEMLGDPSLRTWTRDDEANARAKLIDEDLAQRKLSFGAFPKLDPAVKMDFRDI